jgi:16S rRNA G1207 methylase RsmC
MSHYFTSPQGDSEVSSFPAKIWGHEVRLFSSTGVFSSRRLDPGTTVLFRLTEPPSDLQGHFLDLGCGIGPIALGLALSCPQAHVDAIDINSRARELTALNAEHLGIDQQITVSAPDQIDPCVTYDEIWSNPPVRIGKQALHDLLNTWLVRLKPTGKATLVVGKNLGADSLKSWLETQQWIVTKLGSSKGFRVLEVRPGLR